jgi:hypothetical protein
MSQVFHILKKDARCFSAEISFLLAVSVASAWMQARNPYHSYWSEAQLLTIVAAAYLIARVVHAEALDGDQQFWITRPYRWKSLLAAKLAFIGVFAGLPVFFTHAGALAIMAFSPAAWLVPLATANIRLLVAALLAATLASVTKGIAQYSLLALLALGGGAFISERIAWTWTRDLLPQSWPFLAVTAAAIALGILLIAYRTRWTFAGRIAAIGACPLWAPLVTVTPARERPITESKPEPVESASVEIKVDGIRSASSVASMQQPERRLSVAELTISARGIPDGLGISAYRLTADFQEASGPKVSLPVQPLWDTESQGADQTVFKGPIVLPQSIEGDRPGLLQISFHMQLARWHSRTVTLTRAPLDVFPGLQCYLGLQDRPVCRAPGRWPSADVRVISAGRTLPLGPPFMSGGFGLDLFVERSSRDAGSDVTLLRGEHIGWFTRHTELDGVRPRDLVPTR